MTNVALVARKLSILNEHLRRLRERLPADLSVFKADPLLQDAIALSVLVVVQEAMDISLHIASDEGWELASTYRDSFLVLERNGLLKPELTAALVGAAQLRNRIAHGYASVDVEELPSGIDAFSQFAASVAAFVTAA